MRFAIILSLFVAPLAAAGPVTGPRYVIDVDYWGKVTETEGETPYSVGELVHGSLRIDTAFKPRDFELADESIGDYGINYIPDCERNCDDENTEPSGFVTTPGIPDRGGFVYDHVRLIDSAAGDTFLMRDHEQGSRYADPFRLDELSIEITAAEDFIHGDSLVQGFDVSLTEADSGAGGRGSLIGTLANFFAFTIDRLRATPRLCKP